MRNRALIASALSVLMVAMLATVGNTHATTISDTVEPGNFEGVRELHPGAGQGTWCFEITDIQGHVGQVFFSIRTSPLGEAVPGGYAGGHPKLGKQFCTHGAISAGDYSVGLTAFGGKPASSVTAAVNHP